MESSERNLVTSSQKSMSDVCKTISRLARGILETCAVDWWSKNGTLGPQSPKGRFGGGKKWVAFDTGKKNSLWIYVDRD